MERYLLSANSDGVCTCCPSCEVTYSTIIRPERLLCGACYFTEYPPFQEVLEDVDRELEAAGREHEEAEVESEDEAPESPAKRQCISSTPPTTNRCDPSLCGLSRRSPLRVSP